MNVRLIDDKNIAKTKKQLSKIDDSLIYNRNSLVSLDAFDPNIFSCIALAIEKLIDLNFDTVQIVRSYKYRGYTPSYSFGEYNRKAGLLYISGTNTTYKKGYFYLADRFDKIENGIFIVWIFQNVKLFNELMNKQLEEINNEIKWIEGLYKINKILGMTDEGFFQRYKNDLNQVLNQIDKWIRKYPYADYIVSYKKLFPSDNPYPFNM